MARTTITLDSTSLNTGNYKTRSIQHDSTSPIEINSLDLTREDGRKIISTNHDWKEITLEGTCTGSDQDTFEDNLDSLKLTMNVTSGDLDIAYGGETRRYVVCLQSFTTRRDHYNTTFCNWNATFVAAKGVGEATSVTEALSAVALDDTTTSWEDISFGGTARPYPVISYRIDTAGNLGTITCKNSTTGTQIEIGTAWSNADLLEIDTENKTVQLNNTNVDFDGVFPKFQVGDNDVTSIFTVSGAADSSSRYGLPITTDAYASYSSPTWIVAQAFTPGTTNTFNRIDLLLNAWNYGTAGNHIVRIETDNSNEPSGTLVHANATKTLNTMVLAGGYNWYTFSFPGSFTLNTGTKYWIVLSIDFTHATYEWVGQSDTPASSYDHGVSNNGGSSWLAIVGNDGWQFKLFDDSAPSYSIDEEINYTKRYL